MARKLHIKNDSSSAISAIKKRIRFLERKLIRMIKLDLPSRIPAISQNIERLTRLLAFKKTDKALRLQTRYINSLVASLPPVVQDAEYVADAPAAVAGAPAVIPMAVDAQDGEMFNPEWGMVTPVAQLAPAAFPEFDEPAAAIEQLPATPADQVIRTPQTPPRLVRFVPVGSFERAPAVELAPAVAVPATPQGQIIGTRDNPPALEQPLRYLPRLNVPCTPPHQITTGNPAEPPRLERAPRMLSARA